MEEMANQFSEELQALLNKYKVQLSVLQIMSIVQNMCHKTLSFQYLSSIFQVSSRITS